MAKKGWKKATPEEWARLRENRRRMEDVLKEAGGTGAEPRSRAMARRQAIEDLYWAVLTSREFLFNH